MKDGIHPHYFPNAKVVCTCGNTFITGLTVKELHVEICSNCHPFYTGKQKIVDTRGRVDRYKRILEKKAGFPAVSKKPRAKKKASLKAEQ